jgi:hypothetical protein
MENSSSNRPYQPQDAQPRQLNQSPVWQKTRPAFEPQQNEQSAASPTKPPVFEAHQLSSKPKSSGVFFLILVTAVLTGGVGYSLGMRRPVTSTPDASTEPTQLPDGMGNGQGILPGEGVVCTADAMMCADGSYVGRTGPNCEFVCPGSTPKTSTPSSQMQPGSQGGSTYTGRMNPFILIYPINFSYQNSDITGTVSTEEQVVFTATQPKNLKSFSVRIVDTKGQLSQYIFDQKPTGTFEHNGARGVYAEMPKGYSDGPNTGNAPSPMVAVYLLYGQKEYRIVFSGVSSIQDPEVKTVLAGLTFTK